MNQNTTTSLLVVVLIVTGVALGAGLEFMASYGNPGPAAATTMTTTVTQSNAESTGNASAAPYVLTLVITTNNTFSSAVGDQPAFYVLGPDGLQSSANISLPAHRQIEVVIMNYDDGNATPISPQYDNVTGTVNGTMSVVSNGSINSTQGQSGIVIGGTETVSTLPEAVISHTFTVPQINLNIPVAEASTTVAYFTTDGPGTYSWSCMTPCGSGNGGLAGAMATAGWMSGSVVVGG